MEGRGVPWYDMVGAWQNVIRYNLLWFYYDFTIALLWFYYGLTVVLLWFYDGLNKFSQNHTSNSYHVAMYVFNVRKEKIQKPKS